MSVQDLARSAVGYIGLAIAFCLCSNVVRSHDDLAVLEDPVLDFVPVTTNADFRLHKADLYLYSYLDREEATLTHGDLCGVPVKIRLEMRWDPIEGDFRQKSLRILPEHWYQSVEIILTNDAENSANVVRAKPVGLGRRLADGQDARWAISGQETLLRRGKYRVVARWLRGGEICSTTIILREPMNTTERAYVELRRAEWAIDQENDIDGALSYVRAATNVYGRPFVMTGTYQVESSGLRGRCLLRVGRFSEALAAYEEYMRVQTFIPRGHERYDDMVEGVKVVKGLADQASSGRAMVHTNSYADWNAANAGDVKRLFLADDCYLDLVWCPSGSYVQGSPDDEVGRKQDEDQRKVLVRDGFWMVQSEISNPQWNAVMKHSGLEWAPVDSRPCIGRNWFECNEFAKQLNILFPGLWFRLPTEAEWEYACRAGSRTAFNCGKNLIRDTANFCASGFYTNSYSAPDAVRVGVTKPNAWGIYGMHGNVWEWCQDWYGHYQAGPVTNPIGAMTGACRVIRGGSWMSSSNSCRSAYREAVPPNFKSATLGFRVVGTVRE